MKKFYSINEICTLTKVSVRTLHHYDEVDILKPHHRTGKGHRRYSDEDLLRLQQIATFKFMGFSLQDIKKILHQKDFNFFSSLQIQEQALLSQITHIQKITKLINYLIVQHELQQPVDWKIVVQILEVLKQNLNKSDPAEWYEKYLTESEQQQYNVHALRNMDKWQAVLDEVANNLDSDPTSEIGLAFATKLFTLAHQYYGNEPKLIMKLWEAFKAGIIPQQIPNDRRVIAYLAKAFEKFQQIHAQKNAS